MALALSQDAAVAQGTLINGANHAGVIQVGGLDTWTVQANFNEDIAVSIGEVSGSGPDPNFFPRLRLRGPDSASLGDNTGNNAAELEVRAPSAGTYTVLVSNSTCCNQTGPGSYVLTVAKTPGPYTVSSGDQGGPMTNGANDAGVNQVGGLDPWTIQANFNDDIAVSIGEVLGSGPDPNFFPRLRLRGPDGASLGDNTGNNAAELEVRAPSAGTYTVLVSNSTCCNQSGPGSYVLTVAKTPGPYAVSSGDQGGPMTNGANHAGVNQVGGLDPWTIQANFNDDIAVSIGEVLGSGPDPNFFPRLRLRGPDGASLGDNTGNNAAELEVRAPSTGSYTVLVSSSTCCNQTGPGSYVLTVAKRPGPYTVSAGDEGGPITNGTHHAGVNLVGDLDPWTFQANFNDNIVATIGEVLGSGPDPNFFPRLRLRGTDGASLGDNTGNNAAELNARAPSTGTYTVLVSNSTCCNQTSPGSYSLTVSGLTAAVSSPSVNAFTASPSTITAGQSSTLSWTTTNATTVSISGVSGAQLTIGSVLVSPIVTTTYTLTATGPGGTATATATIVTLSTAPTVAGVSPASGIVAGGTQVTVSGTNFIAGASVSFGGIAATNVSVTSSTTLTCNTPPHSSGAVTVQVVIPGGQAGQLSNAFTYSVTVSPPPARRRAVGH
jgi:hypothetical protein